MLVNLTLYNKLERIRLFTIWIKSAWSNLVDQIEYWIFDVFSDLQTNRIFDRKVELFDMIRPKSMNNYLVQIQKVKSKQTTLRFLLIKVKYGLNDVRNNAFTQLFLSNRTKWCATKPVSQSALRLEQSRLWSKPEPKLNDLEINSFNKAFY